MNNYIKVLHSVSCKLTNIEEEQEIYQILYDGIKKILPESYFLITRLQDDDMNFRITHSFGFEKYLPAVKTLIGKDPFKMGYPFSDLSEEQQKQFESRELYRATDGIYDAVNGKISRALCRMIEKILGVSKVYGLSFCVGKKYFGGSILFIRKSAIGSDELSKECILTIESLTAQASFAINKVRDLYALTKKENELELAQEKFNQLVNQLNDIVWVAKGDGTKIIDLNNSFEKYFGYPSAEFTKNPNLWSDIVHEEDREIVIRSRKELLACGNAECEYRVIKADGRIIWLHERKSIVYDKNGTALQMGGVASDITEKKLLEEQIRLKDYALENSPSAIAFVNSQGIITYINNGYLKLFGYNDKTEILGKNIIEFTSAGDNAKEALSVISKGEIYTSESQPLRKDGSIFDSIIMASPVIHKEKILCMMAVFIDISELKELEAELKESKAKLLKSNQEKDKFFTIIAHDLKSPFNGLLGLMKILSDNYAEYSDEQRLQLIQSSYDSAKMACSLLLELLEWTQLQNNHIEIVIEAIDLEKTVKKNIDLHLNNATEKGISVINSIAPDIYIKIDQYSINTLIRNLFTNAIKFTQKGDTITFNYKETPEAHELDIIDSGVGMTKETINKLFKMDENVSTAGTNDEKGTGLGLLICNEIVERNNWKLNVESQVEKGSEFKIIIPKCN